MAGRIEPIAAKFSVGEKVMHNGSICIVKKSCQPVNSFWSYDLYDLSSGQVRRVAECFVEALPVELVDIDVIMADEFADEFADDAHVGLVQLTETEVVSDNTAQQSVRFGAVADTDLDELALSRHEATTKRQTAWALRAFRDWLSARGESVDFETQAEPELNNLLKRFYAEAWKIDGSDYSKTSLVNLRAGIHRHITSPPFDREINILRDKHFQTANQVFMGVIKKLKRDGKDVSVHKSAIAPGDLRKLSDSGVFSLNKPLSLLRKCFFDVMLHFGRRGQEGLRNLTKYSFSLQTDDENRKFYTMSFNEKDKTHIGVNKAESDKVTRMYEASGDPSCPVASLTKYISKLVPECDTFFVYPLKNVTNSDTVWYTTKPMGHNKLESMMKDISKEAGLSKLYTNHCLKATTATILAHNNIPVPGIMSVTGHRNEASLKSYINAPSNTQRQQYSNILHTATAACTTNNEIMALPSTSTTTSPISNPPAGPVQESYCLQSPLNTSSQSCGLPSAPQLSETFNLGGSIAAGMFSGASFVGGQFTFNLQCNQKN